MLIAKEQQQAWINNYIKQGHSQQECSGFIDGIEKIMSVISENFTSSRIMEYHFDKVARETNADKDRLVANYSRGKLSFYELDLHEETVKRYLVTISI